MTGTAIGWAVSSARLQHAVSNMKGKVDSETAKYELMERQANALKEELQDAREKYTELSQALASTEADYRYLQEKLYDQKEEFSELKGQFTEEFKRLAQEILEKNSEQFALQNEHKLYGLLKPLGEKLLGF